MADVEQLPLFEGWRPDLTEIKLTGRSGGGARTFQIGQSVYLLVRGKVVGVNHERKGSDRLLIRSHKVKLLGARQVDAEEEVASALVEDAYHYLASIEDEEDEG